MLRPYMNGAEADTMTLGCTLESGPSRLPLKLGVNRINKTAALHENQMRRAIFGKSSQTFTPPKCEPSVQMGVVMPARTWHGGPIGPARCGMTFRRWATPVKGGPQRSC